MPNGSAEVQLEMKSNKCDFPLIHTHRALEFHLGALLGSLDPSFFLVAGDKGNEVCNSRGCNAGKINEEEDLAGSP
jgi:hypothetical protein